MFGLVLLHYLQNLVLIFVVYLYLDFIDVFLILNFLGLCEVTYNRIFGGDTSQYEYYTVEDTYSINDETGEATNHQLRQRRTRREKVEWY